MSRIDEALKRASGHRGQRDVRSQPLEAPIVDTYVTEGRPALESDLKRGVVNQRVEEPRPHQFLRSLKPGAQPERDRLERDVKLVTSKSHFVGMEQYRRLAAFLHDAQIENGLKVLTVTSALPKDGKTLTAVNLALTLSESYFRRVLLIDADLRGPTVHETLGVMNRTGLNEVLQGEVQELPLLVVSPTLSVLTAGQSGTTPLAGLASERMRMLLDDCASRFDWVLLDVPPIGLLADAHIIGHLTGAVLLVIRAGETPHALVERAITQLGRETIIGTVLNGVDDHSVYAANYDHQKYGP
jgi:capsular exopolysaccharide synthesis family protein